MHELGRSCLGVRQWEMFRTEVLFESGVGGRSCYLFRNPTEVACFRGARSWQLVIKRQN